MKKRTFEDFTKSPFYDVHSDFMNALTHAKIFSVETLQDTEFNFTKTRITYERLFDEQALSCDAPEIDTLVFTCKEKVFIELQKRGYKSKLIYHLAELEASNLELKDLYTTNILFKRTKVLDSMCKPKSINVTDSEISKEKEKKRVYDDIIGESNHPPEDRSIPAEALQFESEPLSLEKGYYSYRVQGNNFAFQRIRKLDPDFWPLMLKASLDESLLSFSEIHLASDFNFDLLKYVGESVRHGHYEFKGLRPKAYFYSGGRFYEATSVGKRTEIFSKLQKKEFKLETLYVGHKNTNAVSFIIYDKKVDLQKRKNEYSPEKTRIEIRFNFKPSLKTDVRVNSWLAYNLVHSYAYGTQGVGFRLIAMMVFLTGYVRFSNHFNNLGETDIASWWKNHVLAPMIGCGFQLFPEMKAPGYHQRVLEELNFDLKDLPNP